MAQGRYVDLPVETYFIGESQSFKYMQINKVLLKVVRNRPKPSGCRRTPSGSVDSFQQALLVKCGIAACRMRKVKCGMECAENYCGTVGNMRHAESWVGF